LASGERRGDVLSDPSLKTYFCACTSCDREFLVDSYFSLSKLGALSPVDVLAAGNDLSNRMSWTVCFPLEYVETPDDVPETVLPFYTEAARALANSLPNAAGAMFRKTLEAATLSENILSKIDQVVVERYQKQTLFNRILELRKLGVIPPALDELFDTIRLEGNSAVHDIREYSTSEAQALKYFTDALLMQVFSLPAKFKATRVAIKKSETS
jgi:hypothetical protein